MNTNSKGEISEGHVIAYLLKRGYAISIPFGNNQRYDLILDDGDRLWRVQVKTARIYKNCLVFNCCSTGYKGKQAAYYGQADLFLVYSPDLDKVYRIPVDEAPRSSMVLRLEPLKPRGPKTTINWAVDYELS